MLHPINCHVYYDYNKWDWVVVVEDDGSVFEHSAYWYTKHTDAMNYVEALGREGCFAINLLEFPDQNYYSSTIPEEVHKDIINLNIGPKTFPEHFIYE